MTRQTTLLAGSTLALGLMLSLPSFAQEAKRDPVTPPVGERVGEKVDDAVDSIKRGVSNAGEAIREQYEKAKLSVHNMGVGARVYGRLHWDKSLTNANINVDLDKNGVAILKGSVASALAKAKAVELARDTVGVTNVVDQLTIAQVPATGTVPAPRTRVPVPAPAPAPAPTQP